jgi:hypothetical protein
MSTSLTSKQQYWHEHLQHADRTAGSLADYARLNDIPPQKLYRWRNVLKSRVMTEISTETRFTQVVTPLSAGTSLTVRLGNAQLTFNRLPDPAWLASLLDACR